MALISAGRSHESGPHFNAYLKISQQPHNLSCQHNTTQDKVKMDNNKEATPLESTMATTPNAVTSEAVPTVFDAAQLKECLEVVSTAIKDADRGSSDQPLSEEDRELLRNLAILEANLKLEVPPTTAAAVTVPLNLHTLPELVALIMYGVFEECGAYCEMICLALTCKRHYKLYESYEDKNRPARHARIRLDRVSLSSPNDLNILSSLNKKNLGELLRRFMPSNLYRAGREDYPFPYLSIKKYGPAIGPLTQVQHIRSKQSLYRYRAYWQLALRGKGHINDLVDSPFGKGEEWWEEAGQKLRDRNLREYAKKVRDSGEWGDIGVKTIKRWIFNSTLWVMVIFMKWRESYHLGRVTAYPRYDPNSLVFENGHLIKEQLGEAGGRDAIRALTRQLEVLEYKADLAGLGRVDEVVRLYSDGYTNGLLGLSRIASRQRLQDHRRPERLLGFAIGSELYEADEAVESLEGFGDLKGTDW